MDKAPPYYPGFVPQPPPPNHMGFQSPPAQNINIIHITQFGPEPQNLTCPHCHSTVTTAVETSPSARTHIIAFLCCLFGCIPCAPCVYCIDSCLVKKHYCPKCKQYLGMHEA